MEQDPSHREIGRSLMQEISLFEIFDTHLIIHTDTLDTTSKATHIIS